MTKLKRYAYPPHCHGGAKFKVLIPLTPMWKIHAVAQYKRTQLRTATNNSSSSAAAAAAAAAAATGMQVVNLSASEVSLNSSSLNADVRTALPKPIVGGAASLPIKLQTFSNENLQRDLQTLAHTYNLVKAEMNALGTVRRSLVWLLKKSTQFNTIANHEA